MAKPLLKIISSALFKHTHTHSIKAGKLKSCHKNPLASVNNDRTTDFAKAPSTSFCICNSPWPQRFPKQRDRRKTKSSIKWHWEFLSEGHCIWLVCLISTVKAEDQVTWICVYWTQACLWGLLSYLFGGQCFQWIHIKSTAPYCSQAGIAWEMGKSWAPPEWNKSQSLPTPWL